MGMEQTIAFLHSRPPTWTAVAELLARHGFPISLRMIDGELTLPNETLPESWVDLRLGTPQGMVTVRREADRLIVLVWGNADEGLRQAWNAVVWGFAEAGGGLVETGDGPRSAADYRRTADLPAAIKSAAPGGSS